MKRILLVSFFSVLCSFFLLSQNSSNSSINESKEETQTVTFHVNDPLNGPVEGATIGIWPAVNKTPVMERMVKASEKRNFHNKISGIATDTKISAGENPNPANQPINRLDNIGQWIKWHSGQNTGAVSLTFGGMLNIASRWTPDDLLPYEGMTISHLELYIQDLPTSVTAKIWQGTSQDNLVQVLSQPLNDINSNSWHVLELLSPYTINAAEELWFGFLINDPGTPNELIAGRDNQTTYDGKGNKLKIDNEEWKNLSEFGVDGNWNISAFVVPVDPIILYTDSIGQASFEASSGNYNFVVDKDGYLAFNSSFTVDEGDKDIYVSLYEDTGFYITFNVDMTDVEVFNPSEHIVYLTGSFNDWLTPGEPGSIQMNPVVKENYNSSYAGYNDKSIIYTVTLHLEAGGHHYKYFSDAAGDGWDGGEWPGDPNRQIIVTDDMAVDDIWGVYGDPPPNLYSVTFNILDGYHEPLQDVMISISEYIWKVAESNNNGKIAEGLNHSQLSDETIILYTDANGQASFNTTSGVYTFSAEKPDYITLSDVFHVINKDIVINLNLFEDTGEPVVTFNVDMTDVVGFDPYQHSVYLTGSFTGWSQPGMPGSVEMSHTGKTDRINPSSDFYDNPGKYHDYLTDSSSLTYTATLQIGPGEYQYKYFSNAFGDGWEGGEWPGAPDRNVVVHNNMVVNDTWGVLEQDDLVGFILPYPNQIYNVGVDEVIPIQIQTQLDYNGEYWLYAEINDEWHYVLYSDFEGPGLFDHQYIIPDVIPPGEHKFILDYHFYDTEDFYYAESNSFTIINNNPGLEVVFPQAMDAWLAGNTYEISWNSVNISLVNIHYSLDNGDTWELIASHVASDNGYNSWGNNSFFWQVPQEIEGNYNHSIIRIENVSSPSAVAFSDDFTILNSPIVFNKPLPGQVYEVGVDDVIPIEIEMLDDINAYYYLYVIDGDRSLIFQGYFSGTDIHTYDFIIPETLTTGEYYFYLDFSFGDQGSSGNIQSNSFAIINENSSIEVEQPASGDFWVANHNQYISWNSVNISSVNIYYSLDNGESWNMIAESAPSYEGYYIDGYNNYLWQISNDITGVNEQSLIRIKNATDPSVFGISELFTLSGPLTNIIHPNAETVIAAGQDLQITVSVSQSSWISLFLGDEDENWHYIHGAFSNTGIFSDYYSDTQWITPGTYRLIVEHSETGSYEYGEFFNILPAGTQFNVTFNIEMSAVPGFDPNEHKVYLTGSFADWATPGTDGSVEMVLADYGILTYSAELSIDPGQTQYKYFSDLFGQGWSGSEWAGEPNRNIQVSGNMHTNDEWGVHPEVLFQLQLISNPENGGSLAGAGNYNAGTNIEISSNAHSGFEFISWEDAHGNIISIESDFEYITPPLNWALTANFELNLYTLTLQVNPEEGGSVTGAGDYAEGHDVSVMADPNEGYIFLYWTDEHGNELTNNSEYDFNMPDDDTTLIAYFELGSMLNEISYNDINLYPNPAESYVIIISYIEIQEVQISDITGKIVYSETIKDQEKQIAVDYFDPGMYFVRIYTQQGVIVKKLQVNR